jgi:hypothetical protein
MSFDISSFRGFKNNRFLQPSGNSSADESVNNRLAKMKMHHEVPTATPDVPSVMKTRWFSSSHTADKTTRQATSEKSICSSFLQTTPNLKPSRDEIERGAFSDQDEVERLYREASQSSTSDRELTPDKLLEKIDADWKQSYQKGSFTPKANEAWSFGDSE